MTQLSEVASEQHVCSCFVDFFGDFNRFQQQPYEDLVKTWRKKRLEVEAGKRSVIGGCSELAVVASLDGCALRLGVWIAWVKGMSSQPWTCVCARASEHIH